MPRRRWLTEIEAALADAYAAAVRLPSAGSLRDGPGFRMSSEEWSRLYEALRSVLGESDQYRVLVDPLDGSPVSASVADDFASIYRALRAGVDALHSGVAPEELLFEWRLGFEADWGRHALGALSALRGIVGSEG